MSYKLVIVESPAKCDKIEKYLGAGYKCIASFGHLQQLVSLKDIDINNGFKPLFTPIESKKQQIERIKNKIINCNEVILASDDDREGEGIAWHICELFNLSKETTKRIIFHEITEKALNDAVKNPTVLNMNLVKAQQGRQILDMIVGYKISPDLWENISRKKGLSAGRCQTPALRLIYENQKEIDESPGKKVYNTTGYFTSKNYGFVLNHQFDDEDKMGNFLEESVNFDHSLKLDNEKKLIKKSPIPFTTSGLQQTASNDLHISPKETMTICQRLYEAGYITYMRTDSKIYSKEFVEKVFELIDKKYGEKYKSKRLEELTSKVVDEKEKKSKKKKKEENNNAQEAHEAIRPTQIKIENLPDDSDFSNRDKRMYYLIWKNTMESCMTDAEYTTILAKIKAPYDYEYKYTCEEIVFEGWKIIELQKKGKIVDDKAREAYYYLPKIKDCEKMEYKKIISKLTLKELKMHYTEAKLVQLLEQKGIGRPSTFSSLIEKIQERGYVKLDNIRGKKLKCREYSLENSIIIKTDTEREFGNEKNRLVITPIGILVIEFLINNFNELFDYGYTKNMENFLDKIAKGDCLYNEICTQCYETITNLSKTNLKSDLDKPKDKFSLKIDDKHTYIIGKNGPTIKYTEFDSVGNKTDKFYSIKDNLDMDKLRAGEYTIDDIKDENNKIIGTYKNYSVYLKKGQYGPYLEWNNVKKALKYIKINVPYSEITIDDAINIFEKSESGENSLIRKIDDTISIRSGKYGDYIFYKTNKMNKPKFLKLNGFDYNYKDCNQEILLNWIRDKYNITIN